jgi:V8-like Glu-specific endopeptidase
MKSLENKNNNQVNELNNISIKLGCHVPEDKLDKNNLNAYNKLNYTSLSNKDCLLNTKDVNFNIIDEDARVEVKYPSKYPFCCIGLVVGKYITMDSSNRPILQTVEGTGTLISSKHVLTSAKNVYNKTTKSEYSNLEFLTNLDKPIFLSESQVVKVHYPEEYLNNDDEDYAVLELADSLGDEFGYLGIVANYSINSNESYYLYGFPIDKCLKNEYSLWGMLAKNSSGIKVVQNSRKLIYNAFDTEIGQSGSSIWLKESDGKCFIFGIHCSGSLLKKQSSGLYISISRLENIMNWINCKMAEKIDIPNQQNIQTTPPQIIPQVSNINIINERKINEKYKNYPSLSIPDEDKGISNIKQLKHFNFKSLLKLNLSNNKLPDIEIKYLTEIVLPSLAELNLGDNLIGTVGIHYLSKCNFPNLRILNLKNNEIGDSGMYGIRNLSTCNFPLLTILNLTGNSKKQDLRLTYFDEFKFNSLTDLYLAENKISDQGMLVLAKCSFPKLNVLDLNNNDIGFLGIKYLSESQSPFSSLNYLDLRNNKLLNEGIKFLADCKYNNLKKLDVRQNKLKSYSIKYLKECKFNITLEELNLGYNELGVLGIKNLSECNFPSLIKLNLSYNGVGDAGLDYFIKCKFYRLKELNLLGNKIGKEGMYYLSQCSYIGDLSILNLRTNSICDEGVKYLSDLVLPSLSSLNISNNSITDLGVKNLSECNFPSLSKLILKENNINEVINKDELKLKFKNLIDVLL